MNHQLALNVGLKEESLFDTFVSDSEGIKMAVEKLKTAIEQGSSQFYCFVGDIGVGKSHLLQAACRYKTDTLMGPHSQASGSSLYISLRESDIPLVPDILNGVEKIGVVAIDDVDAIFDHSQQAVSWEKALSDLILKSKMLGNTVLLSSQRFPSDWPIESREFVDAMISVITVSLKPITAKQDLVVALQKRSKRLGFNLPLEVGNYLIKQFSNDLQELLTVLKLLEQASFEQKRRLTLPFVKKVLAG